MGEQQVKIDEINNLLKIEKDQLNRLEMQAKAYLDEIGMDKYPTPYGEMKIKEHWQIKMPEDHKKIELFDWMREQGIFERYATVHAQSLKSLVVLERKEAEARGEDMMIWALPGMNPPKLYKELDFKPAKQTKKEE